jgi:hypothetical protein
VGANLSAGGAIDISSSAGNVTLQAADVTAPQINLSAGGQVQLLAGTDTTEVNETGKSDGLFTTTYLNEGSVSQKLVYDQLNTGAGGLTINAGQGVTMAVAAGSSPASLSQQPGLSWMNQVGVMPNATVNSVALQNYSWNHNKTTLNPVATALISLVATFGLPELGLQLGITATSVGSSVSSALTTAFGLSSTSGLGAALAAASSIGQGVFVAASNLLSGTAIGLVNGDFNFGDILKEAALAGLTAHSGELAAIDLRGIANLQDSHYFLRKRGVLR